MRVYAVIVVLAITAFAAAARSAEDAPVAPWCGVERSLAIPAGTVTFAARPNLPFTLESPHFVVHFSNESQDGYAREVIDAAEYAYRVLIDTLQHLTPPSDAEGGGDARIDIYVRSPLELGGAYGVCVPDAPIRTPYFNSYTSWIELSDALNASQRASVTVHEVYHVVQVGYDRFESLRLLEMFSTWFEDRAYDDLNSHYIFLKQFFRRPDRGLFDQHYTNVPWAIFLTERYGDAIMRETLVRCGQTPGDNPRGAFDGALQSVAGVTLVDEFLEFGTWNYFTSLRDDGAHYSEGADYPAMRCQLRSACYPVLPQATDRPMTELAANYFFFDGDGHRARLRVRIEPEPSATSYLTVVRFRGVSRERTVTRYDPGAAPDSFVVDDWEHCDSLLAIYQIDRGLPAGNGVTISARYEYLDTPAAPWILVLDRDGCRRPFDGDDDAFTIRDGEEGPVASALAATGTPVAVMDAIPYDLDACRAVFVVGGFGDDGVTLGDEELRTLSRYMDGGGDVYLESARLGAWVDSALAAGETALPEFWSKFGSAFVAGEDTLNVAEWETQGDVGVHAFMYDRGQPDHRVGSLVPIASTVLARDERGMVRATQYAVGESVRVVNTVLLGGSTGRLGTTREAFVSGVLELFAFETPLAVPPAPLRVVSSSPNPARDVADIRVEAPSAGEATVTVYDVAGRRVSSQPARLEAGANTLRVATPRASGVYFLVVDAGGLRAHGRFLVIR